MLIFLYFKKIKSLIKMSTYQQRRIKILKFYKKEKSVLIIELLFIG